MVLTLINKAEEQYNMWISISQHESLLLTANKTQVEALCLASYFEGKRDGLIDARNKQPVSYSSSTCGHSK